MGVAATQRGDMVIRRQLQAEARTPAMALIDDLNALPKAPDAGTPFTPVTLQCDTQGLWWMLGPKGWAGFGYYYPSLWTLMRRWRIQITGHAHGIYHAIPLPKEPRR